MSRFLEALYSGRVLLMDGAMGTELIRTGLDLQRETCESWNLLHPEQVAAIHEAYARAGAECLVTNSFRAHFEFVQSEGFRRRNAGPSLVTEEWMNESQAAVALAHRLGMNDQFVLGSVGPLLPTEIPEVLLNHGIWGANKEAAEWCSIQMEFLKEADAILLETQSSLSV